MKKILLTVLIMLCFISPAIASSYCYNAGNGHIICNQISPAYNNGYYNYYRNFPNYYNNYRMPTYYPMPRYSVRQPGGINTVVNYNSAGAAVSVQRGGVKNTVRSLDYNSLNPRTNNQGATFIIK